MSYSIGLSRTPIGHSLKRVGSSRLSKTGKYLFVAEAVRKRLGARDNDEALEEIFRDARLKPTQRHLLITRIPWNAVVTTNYDKLVESAYALTGHIPPKYTFDSSPDLI